MATHTTPKQELNELMVEMFMMIEEMEPSEGIYLQFAELFKKMNINITRLYEMRTILIENTYYQRYIRNSVERLRLTEEQKRKSDAYTQCNCGRFIKIGYVNSHLKTQVHYQGRRNRKYARSNLSDDAITEAINREIALQAFIINHISKINTPNA